MSRKYLTPRQRLLAVLERGVPDCLPTTIHQWQPYHLKTYMNNMTEIDAFRCVDLDAAVTIWEALYDTTTADWQVNSRAFLDSDGQSVVDYTITTPEGVLTRRDVSNEKTTWTVEYLIKKPDDMRLVAKYLPVPKLDKEFVGRVRRELGEAGILRGLVFGEQAGPWQHAACLMGVEKLIFATYDEPVLVHELLTALTEKKLRYIEESLVGAEFDLIEIGGDAIPAEIKRRIGSKACLIGGMDQVNILTSQSPAQIEEEVQRLFEGYGGGGGYILSACDHFFDVPVENLRAFAAAGHACRYV